MFGSSHVFVLNACFIAPQRALVVCGKRFSTECAMQKVDCSDIRNEFWIYRIGNWLLFRSFYFYAFRYGNTVDGPISLNRNYRWTKCLEALFNCSGHLGFCCRNRYRAAMWGTHDVCWHRPSHTFIVASMWPSRTSIGSLAGQCAKCERCICVLNIKHNFHA